MKGKSAKIRSIGVIYWLALVVFVLLSTMYYVDIYQPSHQSVSINQSTKTPHKAKWSSVELKFDNFSSLVVSKNANYIFGILTNSDSNDNLVSSDIYLTRDKGVSWKKIYSVPDLIQNIVLSGDESRLVFLTMNYFYISSDMGTSWTKVAALTNFSPSDPGGLTGSMEVSMDGDKIVAVDSNVSSGLVYSVNGGKNWFATAGAPTSDQMMISQVALSDSGNLLVCTVETKGIYISTDLGKTWKQTLSLDKAWYSLEMSGDGSLIAVGTFSDTGLYTSTDFGLNWRLAFSGPQLTTNSYNNDLNISQIAIARQNKQKMTITEENNITNTYSPLDIYGWIYSSNDLGQSWSNNSGLGLLSGVWGLAYSSDGKILALVNKKNQKLYLSLYE